MRFESSRAGVLFALSLVLAPSATHADPTRIGREVSVPAHLEDGQETQVPLAHLIAHGRLLLAAAWTDQEGGGRPLTKGNGNPLADPERRLEFPFNFNRISAPDANSCAGCHAQPFGIAGGGGDFVANVFVLGQRFDFVTFDNEDAVRTRGCADESGVPVTLDMIANGRATPGMFGSGYIEMLARQMTADMQAIRNGIAPGGEAFLTTKGVFFGVLARRADGTWDTSRVEGLPAPSLASAGAASPPNLIVRPFHQAGAVISLRQFTNNAFNHHHGIQATERFGAGTDPDGDGYSDEMTRADVTAASIFQATMAVPGRVIPRDPEIEQAVLLGEQRFESVGCAGCHVPALGLTDGGWVYSEPNPYNPAGNMRPGDGPAVTVDLNDRSLPGPRLAAEGGVTRVPAYTDLKLHDITSGPADANREPLDMHAVPGSAEFFAGNSRFLTKKLWGAANEPPYFHHGKYTTLRQAVLAHAGEAQAVTDAFLALPESEQDAVIEFIKTLQVLPPGTETLVVDEAGHPRTWPPGACAPGLREYVLAWNYMRHGIPPGADIACLDQAPGHVTCAPAAGPAHWCAEGDGRITLSDIVAIRRLTNHATVASCAACGASTAEGAAVAEIPGDIAPGGGDGRVDIADAVLCLRQAVGLAVPDGSSLHRGDIAPATVDASGLTSVTGDGRVDIADVVLLLRAAVGSATLAWPERQLSLMVDAPASVAAFSATLAVPAGITGLRAESAACGADEGETDATGGLVGITCAAGAPFQGPGTLATLRYRGPFALDPASVAVEADLLDASGRDVTAGLRVAR